MYRLALRQATVYSALLYFALALPAAGQGRGKVKQKQPTDLSPVGGADSLNNLKFRNLGPSVAGGRVAAVVGVAGDRNVYYVGAAAGGVWKTIDGGDSWEAVFKDQPTSSSWPLWATCGLPIPSVECTVPRTAARHGRRSCS